MPRYAALIPLLVLFGAAPSERVPLPAIEPASRHELLRAASWRAARSGLEGDLVDLVGPSLVAPSILVGQLVDQLRPHLEELGDWWAPGPCVDDG